MQRAVHGAGVGPRLEGCAPRESRSTGAHLHVREQHRCTNAMPRKQPFSEGRVQCAAEGVSAHCRAWPHLWLRCAGAASWCTCAPARLRRFWTDGGKACATPCWQASDRKGKKFWKSAFGASPVGGLSGAGLRVGKGARHGQAVGRRLALSPALLVRHQQRLLLVLLLPNGVQPRARARTVRRRGERVMRTGRLPRPLKDRGLLVQRHYSCGVVIRLSPVDVPKDLPNRLTGFTLRLARLI